MSILILKALIIIPVIYYWCQINTVFVHACSLLPCNLSRLWCSTGGGLTILPIAQHISSAHTFLIQSSSRWPTRGMPISPKYVGSLNAVSCLHNDVSRVSMSQWCLKSLKSFDFRLSLSNALYGLIVIEFSWLWALTLFPSTRKKSDALREAGVDSWLPQCWQVATGESWVNYLARCLT